MKRATQILCEDERHWLLLPSAVRKWGQALLHQQCWCWGRDIRRAEGNLLLQQEFSRTRPPAGRKGSPTYEARIDEHRIVSLWGFGIGFCDRACGSVFLSRYGFVPRFCPHPEPPRGVWKPAQLTAFHAARTRRECESTLHLLGAALCWLGDYERRVLTEQGLSYRQSTLKQWTHTVLPPQELPDEWQRLATLCRQRARICTRGAKGIQAL